MVSKVFLMVLAVVAVVADEAPGYSSEETSQESYESSHESFESGVPKYSFSYAVKDDSSSNEFGHQESREGYYTKGSYYVHLPDGRLQQVTYYVDGDSGYVPEVNYVGEAHYSEESYESHESGGYARR